MASDNDESLVVIGAGLLRTGTNSLQLALQQLLGGKCYHGREIMNDPLRHTAFWIGAVNNDPSEEEWKDFFRHYRAAVDLPAVAFYKRLMEVYPNAKVILTVRDPYRWIQSVNSTIGKSLQYMTTFPGKWILPFTNFRYMTEMLRQVMQKCFGFNAVAKFEDEEMMVEAFRHHVEEVKRHVPSEQLLVYEVKDGWDPLCKFLNLPVPPVAFPHVNSTVDFNNDVKEVKMRQLKCILTILILVTAMGITVVNRDLLADFLLRR